MATERDLLQKLAKSARQLLACPYCHCDGCDGGFHEPGEFDHGKDLKTVLKTVEAHLARTDKSRGSS